MAAKRRISRLPRISHARARFLAFKTAEGQATERELRLAVAHLRQCAACAAWVKELGELMRSLRRNLGSRGGRDGAVESQVRAKRTRRSGTTRPRR